MAIICPITAAGSDTWDVVFITTPFLFARHVAIATNGTDLTTSDLAQALSYAIVTPGDVSKGAWVALTITTAANAKVPVYIQAYPCNALDIYSHSTIINRDNLKMAVRDARMCYSGVTIDFDANSLTNAGRVVSAQFDSGHAVTVYQHFETVQIPPSGTGTFDRYVCDISAVVPPSLDYNSLCQSDLLAVQDEARAGVYMSHRFWGLPLKSGYSNFRQCGLLSEQLKTTFIAPLADDDPYVHSGSLGVFSNWHMIGTGWGVSYFRGIHRTSKLRVKARDAVEIVVAADSPYSPFITPGLSEDTAALTIAKEFARKQPHAFPAAFNHQDSMLKRILSTATSVLGGLGIPVVSSLANILRGIIG